MAKVAKSLNNSQKAVNLTKHEKELDIGREEKEKNSGVFFLGCEEKCKNKGWAILEGKRDGW